MRQVALYVLLSLPLASFAAGVHLAVMNNQRKAQCGVECPCGCQEGLPCTCSAKETSLTSVSAGEALNLTHTRSFVVFAGDANSLPGMLFGGKTLAEMDRTAAITVRRLLYASQAKSYVTVGIEKVSFHKAGQVGDLVILTGEVTALGAKSVTVRVKVEKETKDGLDLLADGTFTFVAYDPAVGRAVEHGLSLGGHP